VRGDSQPPAKLPVWRQCRDCQTWFLITIALAERPARKWNSLCPSCLQWEL
jgi:hypothetical protein